MRRRSFLAILCSIPIFGKIASVFGNQNKELKPLDNNRFCPVCNNPINLISGGEYAIYRDGYCLPEKYYCSECKKYGDIKWRFIVDKDGSGFMFMGNTKGCSGKIVEVSFELEKCDED